jgi:hypothetical protein
MSQEQQRVVDTKKEVYDRYDDYGKYGLVNF